MSDTYEINAKITADDSGFQATFDNLESGLNEWGLNLDILYKKGSDFFKGFGVNIDQLASKLGTTGPMLSAMAGAGVVAVEVGKKIFEIGSEFDEASSNIAKATGLTGTALDDMNTSFQNLMGTGIEQNMGDVAEAFSTLSVKLDLTGEPLATLTKKFADFADVNKTSVSSAVSSVSDLMNKWNISTDQAPDLLDQLTKASQLSGASMESLAGMLKTGGAQLQSLGLSLTDSTALFAAFEKGGVNTNTVIKGLQTALTNYTASGKDASTELEKTFTQIENAKSPTEALSIAVETFGDKAGTEMANALTNGKISIDDFRKALLNSKGTVDATGEASDTFADKWDSAINKLKSAIAPIGALFVSVAGVIVNIISDIITEITNIVKPIFTYLKQEFDTAKTVFNDFVTLVANLVKGDWKSAWISAQLIVLDMVNNILNALSMVLNVFVGFINNMITQADKVLDKVGLHINTIKEVSLSASTGIKDKIEELRKSIEQTGTSTEDLGKKTKTAAELAAEAAEKAKAEQEAQTKAEEDAALAVYDQWSQEKEVAEWEAAYLKKKKDDADKKASYESEWADKAAKSSLDLLSKQKGYDELSLQYTLDSIEKQEAAEVAKAKAMGASEATIANIHKTYEDQKTQVTEDAKNKQIAAGTTVADAWANTYAQMVEKANSWNATVSSIADSIGSVFSKGLKAMGEALYNGEDAWKSLANTALEALADILQSIGEQLAALAVVHAVALDFAGAAIAVAGSVAAFIASGVISALADSYAATGTDYSIAGTYMVGEQGPELVTLPQGSTVTNASGTRAALGGSSSKNLSITINSPKQLSIFEARRQAVLAARQLAYGV